MKLFDIEDYFIKKYEKYDIPREVIRQYCRNEIDKGYTEINCIIQISVLLDSYIVNKIKMENNIDYEINIIDSYLYLKTIIKKNDKYLKKLKEMAKKENLDINKVIDRIYEDAIEKLLETYDNKTLLSENILANMKTILIPNETLNVRDISSNDKEINITPIDDKNNNFQMETLNPIDSRVNINNDNNFNNKIKNEKYDISFLKEYLNKNDITYRKLADVLEINININTLAQYLLGNYRISKELLNEILKVFNVINYEKLKTKVDNNELEVPECLKERYDISFLKEYLNKNSITQQKLADVLIINMGALKHYLCGNYKISKELLNEILKLFNVISYEELKKKIENDELEVLEISEYLKEKYDISFLKEYLNKNGVTQQKLADVLKINRNTFAQYLLGNYKISRELLNEILKLFNAINYEELKKKIENNALEVPECLKSIEEEKYDISFLNKYLHKNGVTQQKLADVLKINRDTIKQYLCGNRKISKELLNEILKVFNVISYEELRKKIENDELETLEVPEYLKEKYDISFLNKYLHKNGVTQQKLADVLKINRDTFARYLYGNAKVSKELLNEILKVFNVISYEELKKKIDNDELEVLEVPEHLKERYNISFLNKYLHKNGVTQQKLADILKTNRDTIKQYLCGNCKISKELLNEMLKIFNVISYEELRAKVENDELKVPEHLKEKYDISFLKEYLNKNGVTQQKLADVLGLNKGILKQYLYGNVKISKELLNEILKVFNVISYEELRAKVGNDELEVPEHLKKSKNKTLETIEKNNITESLSYQREEIPKMFNMINLEYLLSLMDIKNISNLDYTIVILLFGGIEKRYYSIDAISNFLQVDKSYIINICIECLKVYKEEFNIEIEKEYRLLYNKVN